MDTIEKIDTSALPMKVEFVAKTKRDDWECFEWRVTFTKQGEHSFWTVPYYCGMAHVIKAKHWPQEDKPKKPSNDDILASLILDSSAADQNFVDWCQDYGYSDDSIKAFNTYKQCLDTATHLRKFLGRDVVAKLAEQLRDH